MPVRTTKRQNFDVTPEQDAEILRLRDALGASSAKDALLRAVRITSLLARETREGKVIFLRHPGGESERWVIPELEPLPVPEWKYLVGRDHPWRRQLYVKGRRLPAAQVWMDMIVNHQSPEKAAEEWQLPLDAIPEIVRYCERNRDLLEMEAAEERRRLGVEDAIHAPARG